MSNLNASQIQILNFIRERMQDGVPPSVREICAATGLKSTSTVHAHLKTLEYEGHITRNAGLNRSIQLAGEKTIQIPILGKITAGAPILAVEEIDGYVPLSGDRFSDRELFALRISGESMINAGILDGDVTIFEKTPTAQNGDIVAALLEDEATVKRIYVEKRGFRLQPENDAYQPIFVDSVFVLGKAVANIRYF